MLHVIHKNGVDGYSDGQEPIVHLVSSVETAVNSGQPWTFTDRHADVAYARYFEDLDNLDAIDWEAMPKTQWADVKEVRQAEFLVHDRFPWNCVKRIVVHNEKTARLVQTAIAGASYKPIVAIDTNWYY
jgi:hypothetical protein